MAADGLDNSYSCESAGLGDKEGDDDDDDDDHDDGSTNETEVSCGRIPHEVTRSVENPLLKEIRF